MLTEPLPSQVDVRKLVVKGAEINAEFPVSRLPGFTSLLANSSGSVNACLRFFIDEQKVQHIDGELKAEIFAICQRCLEPMAMTLESQFQLGIVSDDERAKQLPGNLEPLILRDELLNLADVVEEELLLSLPAVSYHQAEDCSREQGFSTGEFDEVIEAPKENPFKVLASLKSDNV